MGGFEEVLFKMGIKGYMVVSAVVTSIVMSTTKSDEGVTPAKHFIQKIMGGVLAIVITPGICIYYKIQSPELITLISVVTTITSMPIVIYLNKNGQAILKKLTDKIIKVD